MNNLWSIDIGVANACIVCHRLIQQPSARKKIRLFVLFKPIVSAFELNRAGFRPDLGTEDVSQGGGINFFKCSGSSLDWLFHITPQRDCAL